MEKNRTQHMMLTFGLAATAATAAAVHGQAVEEVVTDEGVFTVRSETSMRSANTPAWLLSGLGGWFYDFPENPPGIGNAVALSAEHTWGAVRLNSERLIAFDTDGDGTPLYEVMSGDVQSFMPGVAAARDTDRAAYLDDTAAGVIRVRAYTGDSSDADWEYVFDAQYNDANFRMVAVSRDGSVVAAAARGNDDNRAIFFDGDTGDIVSEWATDDMISGLDLTDDGSLALVTISNDPTVVDVEEAETIWVGDGSGAGNVYYRISGDGNVVVAGGFSLDIYEWDGQTYQNIISFSTPVSEWFGFGANVSRDGSTVGAMSRESADQTVNIRMWDIETQTLIGQETLPPVSGTMQMGPRWADATDDGSRFAFAMWGDGTGVYPEIQVYNQDLELIGEIDMPGSAWGVAITPNGQWVAGTGKAVHANVQGNGGQVATIELDVETIPGDLTGDGTVGVEDMLILISEWGECDDCDDCPADLTDSCTVGVPDLLVLLSNWG